MRMLVENLTYTDPAATVELQAVMRYGVRLDDEIPTEYTAGVKDLAEAEEMFRNWILPSSLDSLIADDGSCHLDFQEYGSAIYNRNKAGGSLLATLDLSIDSIPHITQLRFVKKEAIPEDNGIKTFTRGQIVADTKDEMCTKYHTFVNCIDEAMAKSIRSFINENYKMWQKSEQVYFTKHYPFRNHYFHENNVMYYSRHRLPFKWDIKDIVWIMSTDTWRNSSGFWFWKETWTEYNFKWYDYHSAKTVSLRTNNRGSFSYYMPEAAAFSGVALESIDESRWKVVDNITPQNYSKYPIR